ncbi:hypothetical protein HHK36_006632 [Tetracentron sinense]|uniref:Cupin type-1 domain-containing protein n=1 Tax=Tetracentron sinense TaxID=13715 RepID=A0A834ZLV8_TETSI|nr:hypothetical protein HHK36_006632 [Tetracentron sinense]
MLEFSPLNRQELVLRISTRKMGAQILVVTVFLALTSSLALASDPSPLQDFCVAVDDPKLFVNGKFCKDPKLATAEDFSFKGLDIAGNTSTKLGPMSLNQNPGIITIANAVFGSKPPISDDVLAKAFQVDKKVVDYLQAQFWVNN